MADQVKITMPNCLGGILSPTCHDVEGCECVKACIALKVRNCGLEGVRFIAFVDANRPTTEQADKGEDRDDTSILKLRNLVAGTRKAINNLLDSFESELSQ